MRGESQHGNSSGNSPNPSKLKRGSMGNMLTDKTIGLAQHQIQN